MPASRIQWKCCCNQWLGLVCRQVCSFLFNLFLSYVLPYIKQEELTSFKDKDKGQNKLLHTPTCTHTLTNYHSICLPTDSHSPARQCESARDTPFCSVLWCNDTLQEKTIRGFSKTLLMASYRSDWSFVITLLLPICYTVNLFDFTTA